MKWLAFVVGTFPLVVTGAGPAAAEDAPDCRVVEVELVPSADLQIVAWLEDEAGAYVDTLYISRTTGTYGLGNRPGIMDFNSAWRWPYGRRTTTFPVWAHRHGLEWPLLVFQNEDDYNLSHPLGESSIDVFYCRPLREGETMWDTQTCSSMVFTDKGMLSEELTSRYPPRADLTRTGVDSDDVELFAGMNPFDRVSRATPPGGMPFRIAWAIPDELPSGSYVAWVEVSSEFDQNEHYDYPAPIGIPWSEYGLPYRGQPSVVYRVPFELGSDESIAAVADYEGYGDPDGLDGNLRPPDDTITTGVVGSGASRLMLIEDGGEMFRVRVSARATFDDVPPGAIGQLRAVEVGSSEVVASFVAPGNDGDLGVVAGYEIRVLAGREMTDDTFGQGMPAATTITPVEAGQLQTFTVRELLPRTNYYVGVRAYDECFNYGPLAILHVTTAEREYGRVDACFIATAAYGSLMQKDVQSLRQFRDVFLRTNVPGELLVQAYYTFGEPLARVIAPSDTLRRAARATLEPLVETVRDLRF